MDKRCFIEKKKGFKSLGGMRACGRRRKAYSLFIDELSMKMTWDWLLQIFRGEGEIIDVYVSRKRRSKNNCRFGFVHFKKSEEAKQAIRNLDGVKIKDKIMKVSFARYDKSGMPWNSPIVNGEETAPKAVGSEEISSTSMAKGRKLNDVVKELLYSMKKKEGESRDEGEKADLDRVKNKGMLDKRYLKRLCWRLLEEIFSSNNVKEVKRRLGGVIDEMILKFHQEEEFMNDSDVYWKQDVMQRTSAKKEMAGAFLEKNLINSMQYKE